MKKSYNVGIVGATGAVGREMIKVLEQRKFPVKTLRLIASEKSKGLKLPFKGKKIPVEVLNGNSFEGLDLALFSAGAQRSLEFAPKAVEAGCVVVDNSSAFRMEQEVPLVVPEVNAHLIPTHKGIIANPNCSTIQLVLTLKPLHDKAKIKRVVVSTYQSVSGAGGRAIEELREQTKEILKGKKPKSTRFPHQIAFNVIPHIDVFFEDGYTREEVKIIKETQKIMDENFAVTATTVRVPVFYAHSESVNCEFEKPITPEEARKILSKAPGVEVIDDPKEAKYPLAIHGAGKDNVFVGRIRKDPTVPSGLNFWVVGDNLRKGAALNAIQIAERL
ncbi:MAG: aspartate-semialdehyde dehydrogenase [Candidatus Omnitrophica bacterium]|nr:aspartate-semialdehyde dehydrogenase [Candidatus Omnitrophota bacterium]